MNFTQTNISDILIEQAHGGSGSRQLLVKPEQFPGNNFEAITKGFLDTGKFYDWHQHDGVNEMFIVLKGIGKFSTESESVEYKVNDVITIPAGLKHRIDAEGTETSEYFFFRFKA